MNNIGIIKTIAKGIYGLVTIAAILLLAMIVIMTICWGPFGSGSDTTVQYTTVQSAEVERTIVSDPIESSVKEQIIVYKDGQNDIVECKQLDVFGNNNAIQIANNDVEKILITGHGNTISYSCNADPKIIDHGNYNDVWQRWLT